jgi:hypothetical protein
VIVLARAIECTGDSFRFKAIEVLKGRYSSPHFQLQGRAAFKGRTTENELDAARPGAFAGGCIADDYRINHNYVLFCSRTDHGLVVTGPPFSRVNEEVDGEQSPWTRAIRLYAEVAALDDGEAEYRALQDLLQRARSGLVPAVVPPQMSHGLEEYLGSPSHYMPWKVLKAMHSSARTKAERSAVLKAIAGCDYGGDRPEMNKFLKSLLGESFDDEDLLSVAAMASRVKEPAWVLRFLEAYTDQAEVARAIRLGADGSHIPAVLARLKKLTPQGVAGLAPLLARYPSAEAKRILEEKIQEANEKIQGRYDRYWYEAVGLAALGDETVVKWAIEDLRNGGGGGCCGLHHQILASSPLEEADRQAGVWIQENAAANVSALLQGYGDSPWPPRWERLTAIALGPGRKDYSVLRSLRRLLQPWAADGLKEARDLLAAIEEIEIPDRP